MLMNVLTRNKLCHSCLLYLAYGIHAGSFLWVARICKITTQRLDYSWSVVCCTVWVMDVEPQFAVIVSIICGRTARR